MATKYFPTRKDAMDFYYIKRESGSIVKPPRYYSGEGWGVVLNKEA